MYIFIAQRYVRIHMSNQGSRSCFIIQTVMLWWFTYRCFSCSTQFLRTRPQWSRSTWRADWWMQLRPTGCLCSVRRSRHWANQNRRTDTSSNLEIDKITEMLQIIKHLHKTTRLRVTAYNSFVTSLTDQRVKNASGSSWRWIGLCLVHVLPHAID